MTLLDELIQYSNDVIEDRVISCVKHKWACMRFLRDAERQGTPDFPYIFSEDRAMDFLDWMGFFKHTKGPLAGQYKVPELIEKFIFGNIYGWIHKDTEYRRFRKFYWQVGRKNAKSQDLAIVGLYEMAALGEECSEVYIAATQKSQTRYVWGEADLIASRCEWLNGKIYTKYYEPIMSKAILHPKSGSFFARMSKEEKKKGDGANPQCGLLDEYHLHESDEYYNVLTSGMKMRKQPLLGIITTAGFELNYPCYREEYRYVSEILDPDSEIDNDRYFVMINELDTDDEGNIIDDITDEKAWAKANPIVVLTEEGTESIRDELKIAQDKPEKMRDYLTKTMNVWVNQGQRSYMNRAKWKMCNYPKDELFEMLQKRQGLIGVDLTSKIDLASVAFEFDISDLGLERKFILDGTERVQKIELAFLQHSFMPEATFIMKCRQDRKIPYDLWKKNGWLTVLPGEVIDDEYIIKYIEDMREQFKWDLKKLGFDLYNATAFATKMSTEYGYDCIEVRQGIPSLHEPTKNFRERTYEKSIAHINDPVLNWAVGNAVTREDHNKNIMLDKAKSFNCIDPLAACINAHYLYIKDKPSKSSVYEERGMRSLL
jgi:phage terminase large subunit-like protein